MKLEEWVRKYGIEAIDNRVVFQSGVTGDARWDLFHLSDYHVSGSYCGPNWWLVPGSSSEPHRASDNQAAIEKHMAPALRCVGCGE